MPRKGRRQHFIHRKRKRQPTNKTEDNVETETSRNDISIETQEDHVSAEPSTGGQESSMTVATYTLDTTPEFPSPNVEVPSASLLTTGLRKLSCLLPSDWVSTADSKGFYILLLNSGDVKAVQRQIFVSFSGQTSVHIHYQPCPLFDDIFHLLYSPKIFSVDSVDEFCENVLSLVKIVLQFTLCIGVDNEEAKGGNIPNSYIESMPFLESSYAETCRSVSCTRLVPLESEDVRCEACTNLLKSIRERSPD